MRSFPGSALLILIVCLTAPVGHADIVPQQVTTNGGQDPTISADGKWIAYRSQDMITRRLIRGGSEVQFPVSGFGLDWSPVSNLVVYHTFDKGAADLRTVDVFSGQSNVFYSRFLFAGPRGMEGLT